ncbi:hypothetical protein APSETT444_007150 [Aspergillus pseudonomiae]
MPQNPVASSHELEFKSFHDWNGDRPSQTLIFHSSSSSWWIKVEIPWFLPESIQKLGYFKRRSILQEFIKAIDFDQLDLVDDTVTRISLTLTEQCPKLIPIRQVRNDNQTEANFFLSIAHRMATQVEEDPGRVTYPVLDQVHDLPIFEFSYLEDEEAIAPTVSRVRFKQNRFAYKKIDRPIYIPEDTQCSLEQVLSENTNLNDSLLRRWALQTGRALEILHTQRRTHLDIKPSNVVLDANMNAILIDISGTGGYEWEWLSPEMQKIIQRSLETVPASTSFDTRVATDCWAYGKLLLTMVRKMGTSRFGEKLQSIGDDLTNTDPKARILLSDALERIWGQE